MSLGSAARRVGTQSVDCPGRGALSAGALSIGTVRYVRETSGLAQNQSRRGARDDSARGARGHPARVRSVDALADERRMPQPCITTARHGALGHASGDRRFGVRVQ